MKKRGLNMLLQALIVLFFGSEPSHYSNKIVLTFCKHAIVIYGCCIPSSSQGLRLGNERRIGHTNRDIFANTNLDGNKAFILIQTCPKSHARCWTSFSKGKGLFKYSQTNTDNGANAVGFLPLYECNRRSCNYHVSMFYVD